jgi:pyrrolidone-carboxylate peptidase
MKHATHKRARAILAFVGLGLLAALGLGLTRPSGSAAADPGDPAPLPREKGMAKQPVILLTGYEPFGPGRPPNVSWEAIRDLDGTQWRGFRIVARQARVVWGAPIDHLSEWVAELQPTAVFSFGTGGRGAFAIESLGRNERCCTLDNFGDPPPATAIVDGGPDRLPSTLPVEAYADVLVEKGYPARVSTNAGQYLCEEMLYTLEYLKSVGRIDGTVMFCHVPPLGSRLRGGQVTPEYVQRFVRDLLETWYVLEQGPGPEAKDPRQAEVKEMVERYFKTWSNQDMKGYDECFLPDAVIQFIDDRGRVMNSGRAEFVAGQRDYHRTSPDKSVEVPERIDITFEGKLARAVVYWKLTAGKRIEYGYDHFTLIKQDGKWRIVNLVFYAVPPK